MNMFTISTKQALSRVFVLFVVFALAFGTVMPAFADHDPFEGEEQSKIDICHWAGNSYNDEPETNVNSIVNSGHGGHDNDIIPPFHYKSGQDTLSYPGKNWEGWDGTPPAGFEGTDPQDVYNEDCEVPESNPEEILEDVNDNFNIGICHSDNGETYEAATLGIIDVVFLVLDIGESHIEHQYDIIPEFNYLDLNLYPLTFNGQNLGDGGQEILDNDCNEVTQTDPQDPILGCTDSEATNYNPDATPGNEDAAECVYDNDNTGPNEPTQCLIGSNLLENGDFENPEVTAGTGWDIFSSGIDWTVAWLNGSITEDPSLELHGGVNGWLPYSGEQYAELDGDTEGPGGGNGEPASTRISQTVNGLVVGEDYELSYFFSPRPDTGVADNEVLAFVAGAQVDSASGNGTNATNTTWTQHSYSFTATTTSVEVAFEDAGTQNSLGTFIDNASLCQTTETTDPGPDPEDPWCSFEGEVVDTTADDEAFQNDGDLVDGDRRDISGVENGPAAYQNTNGKDGNSWSTSDFFSLGIGGSLTYEFTSSVALDQPGDDIAIYEITGGDTNQQSDEKVFIEVSEDGSNWVSVGTSTGDSAIDINGLGLDFVKFVRLTDDSAGIQGNNGDGYDVDAIVILDGSCGEEPEEPQACTLTLVSDGSSTVVEKGDDNAVLLSFVHNAWTAVISGAQWVWGDDPIVDPTVETTQTFQRDFNWNGPVTSATLEIASDNEHEYTVSGSPTDGDSDENNFALGTQDSYDVATLINDGANELSIAVTNLGVDNSSAQSNPAGLMYKLTIVGNTEVDCRDTDDNGGGGNNDGTGTIVIEKTISNGNLSETFEFNPSWSSENFFLGHEEATSTELAAGNYSISEILPDGGGWELPQVSCVSSLSDDEVANDIDLNDGETVTCTFTNSEDDGGNTITGGRFRGGSGGGNPQVAGATDTPDGEVLPIGAPNTGAGGAQGNTFFGYALALAAFIGSIVAIRRLRT